MFRKIIPQPLWSLFRNIRNNFRRIVYSGEGRLCPVCNKTSKRFVNFHSREEAVCIHCLSLERHRFVWYFFKEKTNLFKKENIKILHVAPEKPFENQLKELVGKSYITADLFNPDAMVKMDITNIQYPDESFNVIYCGHVLEHVPDDKKAMSELLRVLKKDGWAVLMVPVNSDKTIEDPTLNNPKERLRLFGQEDHVRSYGPDFKDRLENTGFKVKVITPRDILTDEEIIRMGITKGAGDIFFCTKN